MANLCGDDDGAVSACRPAVRGKVYTGQLLVQS